MVKLPSMLPLLGALALIGYKNRDKLGAIFSNAGTNDTAGSETGKPADDNGGFFQELGSLFGSGFGGGTLAEGLGDIVDRFRTSGQAETADSWVGTGVNQSLNAEQLERAIGSDTISDLAQRTGLPREVVLARLSVSLPEAIDRFTPEGRLPTEQEVERFVR